MCQFLVISSMKQSDGASVPLTTYLHQKHLKAKKVVCCRLVLPLFLLFIYYAHFSATYIRHCTVPIHALTVYVY